MSMLSDWKEEAEAAKRKLEAQHPIAALEVDRNVRDAYFLGLVFAALANDYKIDDKERARLDELGVALGVGDKTDVEQAIAGVEMASDKKLLIEECARQIADPRIAEQFLSEFSSIWALGGGSPAEYEEFRQRLIGWMGDVVGKVLPEKPATALKKVTALADAVVLSKREKRVLERKQGHARLMRSLNRIADDCQYKRTIPLDVIEAISRRMNSLDAEKIDWPGAVNAILDEDEESCSAMGSRRAIWKVLGLLMVDYKAEESCMMDELVKLFSDVAKAGFTDKLRKFISRYLRDWISF